MSEQPKKTIKINIGKVFWSIVLIVLGMVIVSGTFYIIPAGERGVVLSFGDPQPQPISEGLHFKVPIRDDVVKIDVKTQKYETQASAASSDLQTVSTTIAVNYHLTPQNVAVLYKEIGLDYHNRVITPAVQELVKASTAQFTAEELITKRAEVRDQILSGLKTKLDSRGIIIEDISIVNFDFSASFNNAIEAKVTAEQEALAAKNKLEQVKYEAEQRVAQATAEAEAIKIQAESIQNQGGKEYVQLQAIQKWNGALPQYNFGGGALPFIGLPGSTTTQTQ